MLVNLDVSERHCNESRIVMKLLCKHIIKSKFFTTQYADNKYIFFELCSIQQQSLECTMVGHQFSEKSEFSIIVHKAKI